MLESNLINNMDDKLKITITKSKFTGNADYDKFKEYKEKQCGKKNKVMIFQSNSGNTLICPCPTGDNKDFHHIRNFLINASDNLIFSFFRRTGEKITEMNKFPIRLRTIGHHVPWFHFRLEKK